MSLNRADAILVVLALATLVCGWLGEGAVVSGQALSTVATLSVCALSGIKGLLIALDYMELRHAPPIWRRAVLGWLVVVLTVIALMSLLP